MTRLFFFSFFPVAWLSTGLMAASLWQFYEQGHCRQGAQCSFAHGPVEKGSSSSEGNNSSNNNGGGRQGGNRRRNRNNNNNNSSGNNGHRNEPFVMPERPPLQLPDYNAGKSPQQIQQEKDEEAQRLGEWSSCAIERSGVFV